MRHAIMSKEGDLVYCEVHEWAEWFGKFENRKIAHDTVLGFKVSTVFLGLNHKYFDYQEDQWFETMVFGPEHPYTFNGRKQMSIGQELWMERTATIAEARAAHQLGLTWLQQMLDLSRDYQLALPWSGPSAEPSDVLSEVDESTFVPIGDILAWGDTSATADHTRFFGAI